MRKRLHHIAPLFFLMFLLLPFTVLLFLQGARWYLQSHVAERMKAEKTETVVLSTAAVNWEKPGKELWIDGMLFDVEQYSVSGNVLTAVGFFDEEETGLFNVLARWQKAEDNDFLQQLFLLFQVFAATIVMIQAGHPRRTDGLHQHLFFACLPDPHLLVFEHPPRR